MKVFLRILAVLALLFVLGIALMIWIGFEIRDRHQELFSHQWGRPAPAVPFPDQPDRPTFEPDTSRAAAPSFNRTHGYYDEAFELLIQGAAEDVEIWYTTDGSTPLPDKDWGGPNGQVFRAPILIEKTTHVTAIAVRPGKKNSLPLTQTYLFLQDVLQQSTQTAIDSGWPRRPANGKRMDYGMDPDVVSQYSHEEWEEAFSQISTLSVVTEQANLTHPGYGIYTNPTGQGKGWERYASLELIPNDESPGFQVGAGIRIRGGFTRNPYFVKHSFRLFFRKKYGAGKLKHALFDDEGADRFDKMDLRTAQNYSWAREGGYHYGSHNTFVREVFCRDTQRDMGSPYTRSRYYHLFLNGQYWGIYMTEERPEAAYGATYFEGEREDFDTLKCSNFLNGYTLEATDGNTDAWKKLWGAARALAEDPSDETYAILTGKPGTGSASADPVALVDVDNLINYMLIAFYAGNTDGPLSAFLGNERSNNWFAIRNRNGKEGFRFFVHDAEHTLGAPDSAHDRTGPYRGRNQNRFRYSNPQWIHQDLMNHPEYRKRFSELAQQHLTGNGALTTARSIERFRARAAMIDRAMRAQSARWGDAARPNEPYQVSDWEERIEWVIDKVLTGREDELIAQLREDGLYLD